MRYLTRNRNIRRPPCPRGINCLLALPHHPTAPPTPSTLHVPFAGSEHCRRSNGRLLLPLRHASAQRTFIRYPRTPINPNHSRTRNPRCKSTGCKLHSGFSRRRADSSLRSDARCNGCRVTVLCHCCAEMAFCADRREW